MKSRPVDLRTGIAMQMPRADLHPTNRRGGGTAKARKGKGFEWDGMGWDEKQNRQLEYGVVSL